MDTPFALRGFLAGSGSGCSRVDGLRQPPSLEQLRGHKAVSQFPFCPQPSISLPGTRAIHASRAVLEFANRPLSPHIALKKPQMAATYSISHRIFGASLASAILLGPILMKYSVIFDV